MNKTKIDWPGLDYTWNPVIGCRRGCYYCYARKLHNSRHQSYLNGKLQNHQQYAKDYNEIQFLPERLLEPARIKKSSKIFVGSMCDLFGDGVSTKWIVKILEVCDQTRQHTYMFLTKNPERYAEFRQDIPDNCQIGTTITGANHKIDIKRVDDVWLLNVDLYKFLSIEPLLGPMPYFYEEQFTKRIPADFDLVIVGAMTGKNAVIPKPEWIESIKHSNIYYKKNIREYLSDCDIISPLHINKQFKINAKIKNIKKWSPKPVID